MKLIRRKDLGMHAKWIDESKIYQWNIFIKNLVSFPYIYSKYHRYTFLYHKILCSVISIPLIIPAGMYIIRSDCQAQKQYNRPRRYVHNNVFQLEKRSFSCRFRRRDGAAIDAGKNRRVFSRQNGQNKKFSIKVWYKQ